MTAKQQYEDQAGRWDRAGRPADLLLSDWSLMALRCWSWSEGGKQEGVSEILGAFMAASEAASPASWLDDLMSERDTCIDCGAGYRVENLAVCTACRDCYCYRCAAAAGRAGNGNPQCRCGGEIVG
jgi:hypothetical protein